MHSFKDNSGREWKLDVNVASIEAVREGTDGKVDLLAILDDKGRLLKRLATDPILLVATIAILCEEQLKAAECSPQDFGRAMAGDVIAQATDALIDETIAFFPQATRTVLVAAVEQMRGYQTQLEQRAVERIQSPAIERALARKLDALDREFTEALEASSG